MSKLTRKQNDRLVYTLRNLERASTYINGAEIAVARRDRLATTTLHYTRADGACLYEVERAYGSDLVGLQNGIEAIRALLKENQ